MAKLLLPTNVMHDGAEFKKGTPYDAKKHESFKHLFVEGGMLKNPSKITNATITKENQTPVLEPVNDPENGNAQGGAEGGNQNGQEKTKADLLAEIKSTGSVSEEDLKKYERLNKTELEAIHKEVVG